MNDERKTLLHLIDDVSEAAIKPIEDKIKELCKELGHKMIDDQCGRPEHRYCVYCNHKESDNAKEGR